MTINVMMVGMRTPKTRSTLPIAMKMVEFAPSIFRLIQSTITLQ